MSDTKTFHLPDLGEGLPDAEIVEWFVDEGADVELDAPLVSMETAKAVVEVPSPFTGKLVKRFGNPGDVIDTGAALAEFVLDPNAKQRAEGQDTGHAHGPPKSAAASHGASAGDPVHAEETRDDGDAVTVVASDDGGEILTGETPPSTKPDSQAAGGGTAKAKADAGTVVGAMESSDRVHVEQASSVGGARAMPAVRAVARKLKVDLASVRGTGLDGVISMQDVRDAATRGTAPAKARTASAPSPQARATPSARPAATQTSAKRPAPDAAVPFDTDEPIRGVRRNMVRVMSAAHAEVVPTTLMDDADLHAWPKGTDVTVRLIRAVATACAAVPALNSWLDAKAGTLRRHSRVDVGIAVDSPEGLFVPALRGAESLDASEVREAVNRIRDQVRDRSIPAEDLRDYTIMLSNFGVFAGKYATPVVVPPCVAIIAAGKLYHAVVPVLGALETHRQMPLSLTFDHRACTGGEAARFLRALIDDLQWAH